MTAPTRDLTSHVLDALHSAHHRPGDLTMLHLAEHVASALADDLAARLAAVEALTVEWTTATCQTDGAPCSWHRVSAECAVELTAALSVTTPDAGEGVPSSSSESSGHVDAQTTGQPEAMRLDAPDAGQREAQERAEVDDQRARCPVCRSVNIDNFTPEGPVGGDWRLCRECEAEWDDQARIDRETRQP